MDIVDSKGNTASVQYAELPSVLMPSWSLGIKKLFDFLEERERVNTSVLIADSRIGAIQVMAMPVSAD